MRFWFIFVKNYVNCYICNKEKKFYCFLKLQKRIFYERSSFSLTRIYLNCHTIIQFYDDCYDRTKFFVYLSSLKSQNLSLYFKNLGISTNICDECKMTFMVSALPEFACWHYDFCEGKSIVINATQSFFLNCSSKDAEESLEFSTRLSIVMKSSLGYLGVEAKKTTIVFSLTTIGYY